MARSNATSGKDVRRRNVAGINGLYGSAEYGWFVFKPRLVEPDIQPAFAHPADFLPYHIGIGMCIADKEIALVFCGGPFIALT